MFKKTFCAAAYSLLILLSGNLSAGTHGKVDVGVTHIEVDVVNNGQKVRNLSMWGIGTNATVSIYKAWVAKPTLILTEGEANYFQAGMGTGFYIPFMECFSITPSVGGSYSWLRFNIDLPQYAMYDLRQRFLSRSFNVGFDACWNAMDCLSFSFGLQYAWVNTQTTIGNFDSYRAESSGFNYLGMVDYYFCDCYSVNLTAGFQQSRDKEKHGSDAVGIRLGLGHIF